MEIILDVIAGDSYINNFMHAGDVFESGKHLGDYQQMTVSGNEGIQVDKLISNLKNALEHAKQDVIFIGIKSIDGVKSDKYPPYIKEGVQTISYGKKWVMFNELLKVLGYNVETNECMMVMSAKLT